MLQARIHMRWSTAATVVALQLLVCVGAASAQFAAQPGNNPIARIEVKGNRRVEDAAIATLLLSRVGQPLRPSYLATDVRAIWSMGKFDDVRIEVEEDSEGPVLIYIVREKPSVRRIIVGGNDEIDLEKINEVLDLKRDAILDIAQVTRNVEKIRDLYTEKGFFLAEVTFQIRQVNANEIDIIFKVEENAKVSIRQITIIGNKSITDNEIKAVMQTKEGAFHSFFTSAGTYQQNAFERDMVLISALYYDRGFVSVKVSDPQVVLSANKRFMYITVYVEEGNRYKLGKLDVRGKELLWPKEELLGLVKTKTGEFYKHSTVGKDRIRLSQRYKDKGYAYANISLLTNVDAEKRLVNMTFDIQKGPIVTFERINIRGNSKTRDKVIRRELRVAEGDRFSQTKLERSRARVQALGFFENVNLSTARGTADDRIVVNIEVKERPTGTFQIGAGFSSVENFIAQAQISQNNLFGRGQRLTLQAQISGLRQLFSLSFLEPYFLESRWTFGFDLFNSLRAFDSFNRNATGGSLTWGYPIFDNVRLFLTYKAEQVDVGTRGRGTLFGSGLTTQLPTGVNLANLFRDGFTSSMRLSVQWDRRNNRLFPTKGFFQAAWAEFANNAFGSQNQFNRYGAFSRWYYPLIGPFIFKFNAQIGIVTSPNAAGVPIFERFFTGGILDVRGFRPRSLGPTIQVPQRSDPNSQLLAFNKGGNKELIFNAEIEFPIFQQVGIRGVVFSDAGMAYDDDERISLGGLRHSWGFGIRWFSLIGPLRFEWGLPFSPAADEDPIVFEFTIGNFF